MSDAEDASTEYELTMPFPVCQSHGGPYDDGSFAAGWMAGRLDSDFEHGAIDFGRWYTFLTTLVPQVDLIAMKHSAGIESEASDDVPEWSVVCFHPDPPIRGEGPA